MKGNLNWLDRVMLAVTFAEAGCPELAGDYTGYGKGDRKSLTGRDEKKCASGRATRVTPLVVNH